MTEKTITEEGAVALEESQLDAVRGLSLNFTKIDHNSQPQSAGNRPTDR